MASLSIPLPRTISDNQFIADLMNLLERRNVKCGEAASLADFAAQLESNHALRSDLFMVCTAISHMGAQDLTGEELLVLVAKALGGPGMAKGAAAPEIPESMRRAFLGGYKAWGNRAAGAIEEPLVRPAARKPEVGEEAETGEPRDSAESSRTIQAALEIARERSPTGMLSSRTITPVPNIEHLNLSELKKLLQEIEHRVGRIEPHLDQADGSRITVLPFESGARMAAVGDPVDRELEKTAEAESFVLSATAAAAALIPSAREEVGPEASEGEIETPTVPAEFLEGSRQRVALAITQSQAWGLLTLAGLFVIASAWGGAYVYRAHVQMSSVKQAVVPRVIQTPSAAAAVRVTGAGQPSLHVSGHAAGVASSPGSSKRQVAAVAATAPRISPATQATPDAEQNATANASQGIFPVHVPSAVDGSSTTIIGYATKPLRAEKANGISGTVMVEVSISKQGTVTDARVVSGPPELHAAAVETVRQWRFKPSVLNGTPTEVTTTLGVYFKGE